MKACSIGDWFVLYQMSKNLNKRFFHEFLISLSREVKELKQELQIKKPQEGKGKDDANPAIKLPPGINVLSTEVKPKDEPKTDSESQGKRPLKKKMLFDSDSEEEKLVKAKPATRSVQKLKNDFLIGPSVKTKKP